MPHRIPVVLIEAQLDILRRIAERGLELAHEKDPAFVDIFQHSLDEVNRTVDWYQESIKMLYKDDKEDDSSKPTIHS